MSRYAIVGKFSGDLLTYCGKTIVHDDKAEMEWLLPNNRVVAVTEGDSLGPVLPLSQHPGLVRLGITFPLDRREFL